MKSSAGTEWESHPNVSVRVCKLREIFNKPVSRSPNLYFRIMALHAILSATPTCVGDIRRFCRLPEDGQSLMRAAMSQLNLSARAYHRILKLARTIADLAGSEDIQSVHLAEALQYRPKLMLN